METLYIKNELHLFIESASNEMLENFMSSLESRTGEDDEIRNDLNRIMENHSDIKMKLSLLGENYK